VATEEGEKSAIAGFKINLRSADQSTTSLTKFTDDKGIATFSELQPTLGTTYLINL